MKKSILAVILARGGSKGIPMKNIVDVSGHPLISYSIQAAKNCNDIDEIVVSTDSKKIANVANKYGAKTPFLREKKLAQDKTTSVDALYDAVLRSEKFFNKKFDYIIELPCVAPLRDSKDIKSVIKILKKNKSDSVISFTNTGEKHPTRLKRINGNNVSDFCKEYPEPDIGSRRQDFEPSYIRNGAIYAMTRKCLIEYKSRNGKKIFPFIMPSEKSINIDEKFDLEVAQMLIENGKCNNKPELVKKDIEVFTDKKKRYNLLISAPFDFLNAEKKFLIKNFNCFFITNLSKTNIIKNLSNKDAWLCQPCPTFKIDKSVLSRFDKLKIICTPSTGTTHIDLEYCKKRNIKINSIGGLKETLKIKASSEYTFLLILMCLRKINLVIKRNRENNWRNIEHLLRGNQIEGKIIGILGYGRIGKNIHKYAKSFGAKVLIYDPFVKGKFKNTLHKIQNNSDIILSSMSYNKKNFNFFDWNFFKNLKKKPIFVNTSRGECVNEKDLIKALKLKKILFAAVDVIKNEQLIMNKKNILVEYSKNNNNLIVTPHIAGLTFESEKIAANITISNLVNFFMNKDKKNKILIN